MVAVNEPRVLRIDEDATKGTFTLQAHCPCGWYGDRVIVPDLGSAKKNAPATVVVSRELAKHCHGCDLMIRYEQVMSGGRR